MDLKTPSRFLDITSRGVLKTLKPALKNPHLNYSRERVVRITRPVEKR